MSALLNFFALMCLVFCFASEYDKEHLMLVICLLVYAIGHACKIWMIAGIAAHLLKSIGQVIETCKFSTLSKAYVCFASSIILFFFLSHWHDPEFLAVVSLLTAQLQTSEI